MKVCKRGHAQTEENSYWSKGQRWCRPCRTEYAREWREKNREHSNSYAAERRARPDVREYQREFARRWREENPEQSRDAARRRKAKLRGAGRIDRISRKKVHERDGGRCHICRGVVQFEEMHLDHLIPVSKGGCHTYENVATAHARCNIRRYDGRIPAQLRLIG